MDKLPKWVLPGNKHAIYDSESVTAITMTAKLYAKMNELIEEYNGFADRWNETITEFTTITNDNAESFKVGLRQEFQDFIDTVNLQIQASEHSVESYRKLVEDMERVIEELKTHINNVTYSYDEITETLTLINVGKE